MAGNSGCPPGTALYFVDQVRGIIPDITPALLEKLFDYLKSAGVYSEADIGKVEERQLAAIIGHDDARKLLYYFKKQELTKVNPPSTSAVISSSPVAATFPQTVGTGGSREGGLDNTLQILQVVRSMLRMESDKNREMLMAMQQMQDKTLNVVTKQMSEITAMNKSTIDKMSEQMTQQSKMHQDTIKVMNKQMKTTATMHGETLQAVQQGLRETQSMNAETLASVTQAMASALEAQEKSMQEYRLSQAQRDDDKCSIM